MKLEIQDCISFLANFFQIMQNNNNNYLFICKLLANILCKKKI